MVWQPSGANVGQPPQDYYNTFRGLACDAWEGPYTQIPQAVELYKNLRDSLLNNDPATIRTWNEYWWRMLHFPGSKALFAWVIKGLPGTGKNKIMTLLKKNIGEIHVSVLRDPARDLFGNFNGEALINKLLIQVSEGEEECEWGDKQIEAFKQLITDYDPVLLNSFSSKGCFET